MGDVPMCPQPLPGGLPIHKFGGGLTPHHTQTRARKSTHICLIPDRAARGDEPMCHPKATMPRGGELTHIVEENSLGSWGAPRCNP